MPREPREPHCPRMTTDSHTASSSRAAERPSAQTRSREGTGAAWLLLVVVGLAGFVALTIAVASHVAIPGDVSVLAAARSLDGVPIVWQALSESANIPLIVIGAGMVLWLFFTGHRREALLVLLVLAAITVGSEGVKQLVARPRPEGTDPNIPGVVYSFPSGHVLEAASILGIIVIRTWRSSRPRSMAVGLAILVVIWVVLVGVARMALNAHYPSDVLAGGLGALAALGFYGWFTRPGSAANPRPDPQAVSSVRE